MAVETKIGPGPVSLADQPRTMGIFSMIPPGWASGDELPPAARSHPAARAFGARGASIPFK
jgi:hypothetical protein